MTAIAESDAFPAPTEKPMKLNAGALFEQERQLNANRPHIWSDIGAKRTSFSSLSDFDEVDGDENTDGRRRRGSHASAASHASSPSRRFKGLRFTTCSPARSEKELPGGLVGHAADHSESAMDDESDDESSTGGHGYARNH